MAMNKTQRDHLMQRLREMVSDESNKMYAVRNKNLVDQVRPTLQELYGGIQSGAFVPHPCHLDETYNHVFIKVKDLPAATKQAALDAKIEAFNVRTKQLLKDTEDDLIFQGVGEVSFIINNFKKALKQ